MRENSFQPQFIKRLESLFPGCVVLKNDSEYRQGIPDLLMLWRKHWAAFEVKRRRPRSSADFEPNQEYYIDLLDAMSFAACVYPENEEEVLDALQRQFQTRRQTRVPQRQQRQLG